MILGARRKQALFTATVDNIVTQENKIIFLPNKTLKHSNTHRTLETLIYQGYPLNAKLCMMNGAQCYLGMRENLVDANTKEFIITYVKQHKPASCDTISRWIKDELDMAGINTNIYIYIYKPHSCGLPQRVRRQGIMASIADILKRDCWKSQNTFTKFFSKDISNKDNSRKGFGLFQASP